MHSGDRTVSVSHWVWRTTVWRMWRESLRESGPAVCLWVNASFILSVMKLHLFFKNKLILFTSQLVTVTWKELNAQRVTLKPASVSVGSESPVFFATSARLDTTPHSQPAKSATPATPSGQQMSKMFIEPPRCWKTWSPTSRMTCSLKTIASCNG